MACFGGASSHTTGGQQQTTTIHQQYGRPPNWQRPEGFETLLRIILEQQVSLESAKAAYLKLKTAIGEVTPQKVLQLSDEQLRACYFSRQKTRYAKTLATAILEKSLDLSQLSSLSNEAVFEQLTAVKGIGKWTTEVYLMFCLDSPDIFPLGDIAAINTVKEFTALETKDEIAKYVQAWSPYRTAATFYLWHYYLKKRNREVVY